MTDMRATERLRLRVERTLDPICGPTFRLVRSVLVRIFS